MSYKLLSFKDSDNQDLEQWSDRSLEGELESFRGRRLESIFEKFIEKNSYILEGGCGFGAWCEWFESRGHKIVGIEYDQRIVDKAKEFKPGVAVELGDITDLHYPDNSFDAYISLGVIEHFEHGPEPALEEAFRILKPGAIAIVSTPRLTVFRRIVSHPIRSLYFLKRSLQGKKNYFWEYRFTKQELRDYLESAGFEIIHTDIDDYESGSKNKHIGLWADWFFLRKKGGEMWELNRKGKFILSILSVLPATWYCSGILYVGRANK